MSINLALNSALSGLLTAQSALSVVSTNLSNINNPNYSAKTVNLQERVVGGTGAGVEVANVTRSVDEGLNATVRSALSQQNYLQTNSNFYTQIQNLFGQAGDATSISNIIQQLSSAMSTLAANPTTSAATVIQAGTNLTSSLQNMTKQIQSLRSQADVQIGTAVDTINNTLKNIVGLNDKISVMQANGQSTDDLKDQRDKELSTLSQYMDYSSFTRSDGSISIFTTQGVPLLDGKAQTLSHVTAASVQPGMTIEGGNLQGILVNGTDISGQISSGSLASLFQMRDQTLTNLQSQINTVSQSLQDGLNQIQNRGVSYPNGGQSFTGTTSFSDPNDQKMSISGGDTAVVLLNSDGSEKARTSVKTLMQGYMQANGQPITSSWTPSQMATAMNGWLNTQFSTSGITYAQVNSTGNFSIQLPPTSNTSIAFRDQHSVQMDSSLSSDPSTPLGLSGPLTFRDSAGSSYSINVTASDTLTNIQSKLNALGGLTANLVQTDKSGASTAVSLTVTNNAGLDMTVDSDTAGNNAQSGLGIMMSRSQPAADVTVNYDSDQRSSTFTSTPFPASAATGSANISGELVFRDSYGQLASVKVQPGDSLNTIAININAAGNGHLNATVISTGNQYVLQVQDVQGREMTIDGNTQSYQTAPSSSFTASAGKTLSMTVNGNTYGPLTETGTDTLASIAASINSSGGPFANTGVKASVQSDGTNQWLSLTSQSGQPVSFSGTMVSQLGLGSSASVAMGMSAKPDQQVSGFSNFLGLNDLFVTSGNATTFETQTLTKYSSTQTTTLNLSDSTWKNGDPVTGTPQAMTIDIPAGLTLDSMAKLINNQAVTYDSTHLTPNSFVPQAGTLTVTGTTDSISVSVNIASTDTLADIAAKINAQSATQTGANAGVRAMVATDGTSQWLRLYSQQGIPLVMSGSSFGSGTGQLSFASTQMVKASVINDGAGQRLRLTHSTNSDMSVTGSLVGQTNITQSAVNSASNIQVRSDLQTNPSLLNTGTLLYNSSTNKYYAATGDITIVNQMAQMMQGKQNFLTVGGLPQGSFSYSEFAANIVSSNSTNVSANSTRLDYQNTLKSNLDLQKSNISGVSMDKEVSNLIAYQQAYSASAKVISTINQLFDVLDNIIR